jgi:hypothetical protein
MWWSNQKYGNKSITYNTRLAVGVHRVGEVVDSELVVPAEPFDGAGTVVEASATDEDASLEGLEDVSAAALLVADAAICAGVEVEETNGGAFSIYELSGCTA